MAELLAAGGLADVFGAIQRGLGAALAGLYAFTHSFPLAIILLTLAVRAALLPLTLKSTRSMAGMQKAQPEMKQIQAKYKALQQKARDRMEVQQLRMEMNRELQVVMRRHGANPAGGCLPMVAQYPVLIAMFTVMRGAITVAVSAGLTTGSGPIPVTAFGGKDLRTVVCRPADPKVPIPRAGAGLPAKISCPTPSGEQTFRISDPRDPKIPDPQDPTLGLPVSDAGWISFCLPRLNEDQKTVLFACHSALGTGHLPKDSRLFGDLSADRATVLGMHPGCTANQVSSKDKAAQCAVRDPGAGGGAKPIPYYGLIGLVVFTTYWSTRQMNKRTAAQGSQITPQQQMITRIMPAFIGLISLGLPAGVNLYFAATNALQVAQQRIQFGRQAAPASEPRERERGKDAVRENPAGPAPRREAPGARARPPRQQGSRKRRRKKRRKRR